MRDFNYIDLFKTEYEYELVEYIAKIYELKGKCELYLKYTNINFNELIISSSKKSIIASNEIEGIYTTKSRIDNLINNKNKSINEDENQILGYKDVYELINDNYQYINLNSNYILQLHKNLYKYSIYSFGGKYKTSSNEIDMVLSDGSKICLFKPLEPFETPYAIEKLCSEYNKMMKEYPIEPLILIPIFIHDFLCIHPFNDGNGRISRLLTNMLLLQNGFNVSKYISIENEINKTRDEYYKVLQLASVNWYENKNNNNYFIKYMLKIILSCYKELINIIEINNKGNKAIDYVRSAVDNIIGSFSKSDILNKCPKIKRASCENSLKELTIEGYIQKVGKGRTTRYYKL